jgi:hypothetical protein
MPGKGMSCASSFMQTRGPAVKRFSRVCRIWAGLAAHFAAHNTIRETASMGSEAAKAAIPATFAARLSAILI